MKQRSIGEEPQYRKKQETAARQQGEANRQSEVIKSIFGIREIINRVADTQNARLDQTERNENRRRKRENRTIFALVLTALVGSVGIVISHRDTLKALREAQTTADQQHADTLTALGKTDATVAAMKTQADIMRGQLAEMQRQGRAWVSIEPFLGNVTWDKDGVNINMKITVKNTGKIPALYVVRDARLVPTIAQEDPYTILIKMTTEKRQGPIDVLGVPLFPNDTLDWFAVFKFSREAITKNFEFMSTFRPVGHPSDERTLRPEDFRHIGLTLVYFVDYTFGGDYTHHQHSCMCTIHRTLPNTAAGFALPLDEDLSPPNLRLDSLPLNCQAD